MVYFFSPSTLFFLFSVKSGILILQETRLYSVNLSYFSYPVSFSHCVSFFLQHFQFPRFKVGWSFTTLSRGLQATGRGTRNPQTVGSLHGTLEGVYLVGRKLKTVVFHVHLLAKMDRSGLTAYISLLCPASSSCCFAGDGSGMQISRVLFGIWSQSLGFCLSQRWFSTMSKKMAVLDH